MDASEKLVGLLEYTERMASMNERAIFRLADYRNLLIHEHELRDHVGIYHDVVESEERVWLKIERLVRRDPPSVPDDLVGWIIVGRDPSRSPSVQPHRVVTVTEEEAELLLKSGRAQAADIQSAMRSRDGIAIEKLRDVTLRLENNEETRLAVQAYIEGPWIQWAEQEKPRRESIKIYEAFFNLQQAIETQGVERPLEVVWGIGVLRWKHPEQIVDHPIIEQLIEIEVDSDDGAIRLLPRSTEPTIAIKPYQELGIKGSDAFHRFARDHLKRLAVDSEFTPFDRSAFEPVLRRASSGLDAEGRFFPDELTDIQDRRLPEISQSLLVSDTWAIYARPRTSNIVVEDIRRLVDAVREAGPEKLPGAARRLVSKPDNTRKSDGEIFGPSGGVQGVTGGNTTAGQETEFLFPKPFNEDQIEIVRNLEREDGVVVQGPPGTGKTHTIANIICHYMATGRRVLVISHGEAALSVLRDQIPEEIRELTIALLTSERHGLKQLEKAVRLLANDVTQKNPRALVRSIKESETRVRQLREKISGIDIELRRWSELHLSRLGGDKGILPIDLARLVVEGRARYAWLLDRPKASERPQFDDADVARLRATRNVLGPDLLYVDLSIPSPNDLPDAASVAAIHEDLVNAAQIAEKNRSGEVPPISLTIEDAIERARALKSKLESITSAINAWSADPWLKNISTVCRAGDTHGHATLFNRVRGLLVVVAEGYRQFQDQPVQVPDEAFTDKDLIEELRGALERHVDGQRPFPMVSIGKGRARAIYRQIRVDENLLSQAHEASHVLEYIAWRGAVDQLQRRWNQLAVEIDLPSVDGEFEETARWVIVARPKIADQISAMAELLPTVRSELSALFPFGISVEGLGDDATVSKQAHLALELNLSRIRLEASRAKLKAIQDRLRPYARGIGRQIADFIDRHVGSGGIAPIKIAERWDELLSELNRVRGLQAHLEVVQTVTAKIAASGAPRWAEFLRTQAVQSSEDQLTPEDWRQAWLWAQQEKYLNEIDGRARISTLRDGRLAASAELERVFREVVQARTFLALHTSLTDLVRSSLVQFASAIRQLGAGTGIRARRFRRDARDAMDNCYSSVPCWIMPSWRVSESLPSIPGSFDLVIVDEASQSDVQALPALLRGKKVLVVGDDKQVSPSAVGVEEKKILQLRHNYLNEQPFAAMLLPGRSLYDLMGAVFPSQRIMLKEHFRCVEPIIRFSAREFYDNQIRPLRIPKASERLNPPLIDILVKNGMREGKYNEAEASVVLNEIEKIASDPAFAKRTIGVVSLLGAYQALKIQGMLLERLGEAVFMRHQITCGDAATFQGKERDIMFVSMVDTPPYRAKTGLIYQQRFNVALSRARDRMYLVRSIEEPSTRTDDLIAKVIQHFRNPMDGAPVPLENALALCESNFEREFYMRASERGWRIRPQVRVGDYRIDFVIEGADDRRLAIELDGDKYHGPERWVEDYNRQLILERMGWRFWRCWGSSWTLDPDGCLADLEATLKQFGISPLGLDAKSVIYTEHRTAGSSFESESEAPEDVERVVEAGDRVVVEFNDEPGIHKTFILSQSDNDDPDMGVVHIAHPLARALIGQAEEEIVELPEGGKTREAVIRRIDKAAVASH